MIAPPSPPAHDELEALIKEARARQLRRRLLGAAGVAIVAAIGLGIYALVPGRQSADLGRPPSRVGGSPAQPCRTAQLTATTFFQGATQSMVGGLEVTNASSTACRLPKGRPHVRMVWHGKSIRVRERGMRGSALPPWPAARLLAPGAKAEVVMQWQQNWTSCRRVIENFRPRFDLHFQGGLAVTATGTGMAAPACSQAGTILGVSSLVTPQ